ncbi:Kinesin-like protein KIF2A [Toxocara canis]|uniref:Kinesin-like protein n=1 Tax=Toxocara canis TaxID=6265 RepID=A0A0B2VZM5_TOXCA|nr:Kinesin-like protein KIF2A [Toxocara canis]
MRTITPSYRPAVGHFAISRRALHLKARIGGMSRTASSWLPYSLHKYRRWKGTEMERVNVGMHVDIRRSDGRVHNAVISEVRKESLSVTVEWFENGETKGKEIDLKTLLAINPTLAAPPPSTSINTFANDENRITSSGIHLRQSNNNTGYGQRPFMGQSHAGSQAFTTNGNGEGVISTEGNVSKLAAPKAMHVSNPIKMPPLTQRFAFDSSQSNIEEMFNETVVMQPAKSSTVQEIERLQRNREERRAHQVEVKKQKEQLKNIDPGNPNWQFLTMIREYQSMIDFRPLKITDQVSENRITVCVRKRPLNRKEIMKKEIEVITIPNRDHVIVHQPQVKVDLTKFLENQKFRFDYTFDENSSNEMVYRFTAQPLLKTIFAQGFATCFAYGQTGSGKTHTMGGSFTGKTQDCSKGIYALAAGDVFKMLNKEYKKENLQVGCSFFEIYGGKVFDLIGNKAMLRVLEDAKSQVQIVGLQEVVVHNEQEVLDIIRKGTEIRTAGTTSANQNSSRSHAVFQIILRKKAVKGGQSRLWGKFSLIDLAGNERGVDTISSDRQTRMEGAEINKSLLALKECIRAMGRNSSHVPFRASKLTLVLRDSFIGSNAKTCMIAMISPGMCSCEHTLNTLRYADRVKELGADDGAATPMEDEELMLGNDGEDLDILRSRNIAMISPGMCSCEHTLNTLRYADRVKELGADDGAATPMEDEELMLGNDGEDLDILRSRNGMNEAAYRQQKVLQDIAMAEEKAIDELTNSYEESDHSKAQLAALLNRSSRVDYDMELFASDLMQYAAQQRDRYIRLYECAEKLHTELHREIEVSNKERVGKRH